MKKANGAQGNGFEYMKENLWPIGVSRKFLKSNDPTRMIA
jgi:hypothetical protein